MGKISAILGTIGLALVLVSGSPWPSTAVRSACDSRRAPIMPGKPRRLALVSVLNWVLTLVVPRAKRLYRYPSDQMKRMEKR